MCTASMATDKPKWHREDASPSPIGDSLDSPIEPAAPAKSYEEQRNFYFRRNIILLNELDRAQLKIRKLEIEKKALKKRTSATISFASVLFGANAAFLTIFIAVYGCPNAVKTESNKIWNQSTEWASKMMAPARSWLLQNEGHSMGNKTLIEANEKVHETEETETEEHVRELELKYEEKIIELENQKHNCEMEKAVFDQFVKVYDIFYKVPYVKTTKDLLIFITLFHAFGHFVPYLVFISYHCIKLLLAKSKEGDKSDEEVKENIPLTITNKQGETGKGTVQDMLYNNEVFNNNPGSKEVDIDKSLQNKKINELEIHVALSGVEMKQLETRLEALEKKLTADGFITRT